MYVVNCITEKMKSNKRKMYPIQSSMFLDKETAKAMCTQKLRKFSKNPDNLCQTVVVRNTLKYVQSSKYTTLHGGSGRAEYKPLEKKHCAQIPPLLRILILMILMIS